MPDLTLQWWRHNWYISKIYKPQAKAAMILSFSKNWYGLVPVWAVLSQKWDYNAKKEKKSKFWWTDLLRNDFLPSKRTLSQMWAFYGSMHYFEHFFKSIGKIMYDVIMGTIFNTFSAEI